MRRYKTLIFDLDGTLVDTAPIVYDAYNVVLTEYDKPTISRETFDRYFGMPPKLVMPLLGYPELAADPTLKEKFFAYQLAHADEVQLFPQVRETLTILHERGVRIALCTSATRAKTTTLLETKLHLLHLFDVVVTGDDVTHHKPHPEPIDKVLAELSVTDKSAVAYVGDASMDIDASRAAGVTCIIVTHGHDKSAYFSQPPDYTIDRFDELLDILRSP